MLIKCTECGNSVSDNASACPHCGNPMQKKPVQKSTLPKSPLSKPAYIDPNTLPKEEEKLFCPYCLSSNIIFDKKGFSGGKAVAGVLITGGVGALAGTFGMNKIVGRCVNCNKTFTAEEAVKATKTKVEQVKHDVAREYGSVSHQDIQNKMSRELKNVKASNAVENIKKEKQIDRKAKDDGTSDGCVIFIAILIIIAIVVAIILW